MTAPNLLAAKIDYRPRTPLGFAGIWFRRVSVDASGQAPDWVSARLVVTRKIPGGTFKRYDLGRQPDQISIDVELDSTADAAALRALVGTSGTLTLPHARYDNADYGTGAGYPDGTTYRSQTAFLASIGSSVITLRQTVRLTLSLERDPV